MAANVSVCLSFDFDAICVWLGQPERDFAERDFARRVRRRRDRTPAGNAGAMGNQVDLVHPRPHHRHLPRPGAPGGRCGT